MKETQMDQKQMEQRQEALKKLAPKLAQLVDSGKWSHSTLAAFMVEVERASTAELLIWSEHL